MGIVGDGRTTEEVGHALRVSEKTVKNDIESVCRKLQARNRTHAVRICAERGIIASGGLRQGTALLNGSGALAVEHTAR